MQIEKWSETDRAIVLSYQRGACRYFLLEKVDGIRASHLAKWTRKVDARDHPPQPSTASQRNKCQAFASLSKSPSPFAAPMSV